MFGASPSHSPLIHPLVTDKNPALHEGCLLFNVLLGSGVLAYPDLIQVSVEAPAYLAASKLTLKYYPTTAPPIR